MNVMYGLMYKCNLCLCPLSHSFKDGASIKLKYFVTDEYFATFVLHLMAKKNFTYFVSIFSLPLSYHFFFFFHS